MKDLCTGYLGNNIKIIHNKIDTTFTKETNKLFPKLTNAQYLTLIYLSEQPNGIALQKEIETKFELSHPTTVGIIKRLQTQQLIKTRPYKKNKRQTEVILDNKGKTLLAAIKNGPRSILTDIDNNVLKGFSKEERQQLDSFLQRINKNLNPKFQE